MRPKRGTDDRGVGDRQQAVPDLSEARADGVAVSSDRARVRSGAPLWRMALVLGLLATSSVTAPGVAQAREADEDSVFGPYIGFATGVSKLAEQDARLVNQTGRSINSRIDYQEGALIEFDVGLRVHRFARVEVATTYRMHEIESVQLAAHDGELESITSMINAIFEYPMGEWEGIPTFVPYVGAGIGVLWTRPKEAETFTRSPRLLEFEGSSVELAWNVQAGFEIPINRWMGLRLGYRYVGANESSWNSRLGGVDAGDIAQEFHVHEGRFGLRFGY